MYDDQYANFDDDYSDGLVGDLVSYDDDGNEFVIGYLSGTAPPRQKADDDERIRDWQELDSEPDREELIPDWLFSQGVTGLVGEPGYGKTTLAVSIAMTVNSVGGMWADNPVKEPRPVLWIVGDDKFSLKLVRKTWLQEHPGVELVKGGGWIKRPLDFADEYTVSKLIKKLKGLPPMLIVLDLVSDMYGDRDDEKGKDVTKVYKHIWWVVTETGATFLCLQLPPWGAKRGKGSINIKGKNDIVLFVNAMEPDMGYMELEHQKRREGREVEKMVLEVKLVDVASKPQPVPIVTGRLCDALGTVVPPKSTKPEDDQEFIVATLKVVLGNRATTVDLVKKVQELKTDSNGAVLRGWAKATIYEKLAILREQGRIAGGGGEGEYNRVVDQPTSPVPTTPVVQSHIDMGLDWSGMDNSEALQNHSRTDNWSGSSQGRTEGQGSPPEPSGEDLIAKATAQARAAPDPTVQAAADRAQARSDATKTKMK
jgi:hypothetical protein